MKVGVLQFFGWLDRSVPLASIYDMALERISIMDATGYDAVWLAEHHFSSFSVCPSVHMMGVMAAARTKRLRIGTAVSLAPFYNPLRLAEGCPARRALGRARQLGRRAELERSEFGRSASGEEASRASTRPSTSCSRLDQRELTYLAVLQHEAVRCCPSRCKPRRPWMAASSPPRQVGRLEGLLDLMDRTPRADLLVSAAATPRSCAGQATATPAAGYHGGLVTARRDREGCRWPQAAKWMVASYIGVT
jgi:alkanesulfonate monooxygenase SsuD/methylene tetrahydromethanopterin reductase-like flavin-dependent oxidoreductase (luciferase family)